ncbi:MAG: tetratricopeptide repeat protein [Candidatus Heimdallarchaeota archaeon]
MSLHDPKRFLAEVDSLIEAARYDDAQIRLQEVMDLKVDKETGRQILLLKSKLTISQFDPLNPELLTELKGLLESDVNAKVRAEVLHVLGKAEIGMGRYPKAVEFLLESLSLYRRLGNPKATVSVLNDQAKVLCAQGHWDEFKKVITETLKLANDSGDSLGYGTALISYAAFERSRGFHDLAIGHYELARQLMEEVGDNRGVAVALNNLADIEITRGSLSNGLHLLRRALFHEMILGIPKNLALAVTQIGRVHLLKGNLQEAEGFLRAAIDLASSDRTRNPYILYFALCNMADFERKRGDLDRALLLSKDALALLEQSELSGTDLAFAWGFVTSILLEMRKMTEAEEALGTSEVISSSLEFIEGIVNNILLRGLLELQKGNFGFAQEYFEKARERAEENKLFEVLIQTELSLADLYLQKLMIKYEKTLQENATNCLFRASRLAEETTSLAGKLEAKILEGVGYSINLKFEEAAKILQDVETKARVLELHLIEKKARKIKKPLRTRMRALGIAIEPDEELLDYVAKAQEYVAEAQAAFRGL